MKCSKCGKYIPYDQFFTEERVKLYQEGTDEDRKKFFDCDCGEGKMVASLDQKKDEKSNKTVLLIDGHEIDYVNFNKMRKYILYQNLPDFKDDSWADKAIRDDQAKRAEILSKDSGKASLERKMLCVVASTGIDISKIYDMSIRKFIALLGVINDYTEYKATKVGLMSGMVSLKKGQKIDHWIYTKEKSDAEGIVDSEAFAQQFKNA